MKRLLVFAAAAALFWPAVGCKHHNLCGGGHKHDGCSDCGGAQEVAMPQAPGHVAYPYYTVKGPRDFLHTP